MAYDIRILQNGMEVRRITGLTKDEAREIYWQQSEHQSQYTELVVDGEPKKTHEAEKLLGINRRKDLDLTRHRGINLKGEGIYERDVFLRN